MTTRITTDNITDATIGTADLASSVPLNVQWQAVKTSDFTAVAGEGYFINTASGAVTVTLPSSPNLGDTLSIVDYGGTSATNNIILAGNGSKILASSISKTISTNEVGIVLVFTDSTKGWVVNGAYVQVGLVGAPGAPTIGTAVLNGSDIDVPFTAPADNGDDTITSYTATSSPGGITGTLSQAGSGTITVTGLSTDTSYTFTVTATNSIGTSAASAASNSVTTPNPSFIAATGGTVTTVNTDYKVHTFTGDGCFVVTNAGNIVGCSGGPSNVDYMIVAGGGGGGGAIGGGGGGGGYRESYNPCTSGSYSASPLATPTSLTISATTYPITVGAGGTGQDNPSAPVTSTAGSNSVFSTITSAGGGAGPGGSGGSGAGGGHQGSGGSGNTPPVSPPQGSNGANNSDQAPPTANSGRFAGGGGGGAGGVGNRSGCSGYPSTAGPGGPGVSSSITGSSVTRAGGGGGGAFISNTPGSGGSGGGGAGAGIGPLSSPGTVNTGGGGGGGAQPPGNGTGGNGGKGIVVIRYKFQ